nr:23S rRNA (guanine(745)-N(1))-methyltransferase [Agarivorans gilvus]
MCQASLSKQNKQWSCSNGHCFDQAKEGYTNLLAVQHKHSKLPGDSKAMLQARRAFLNQGYFAFLADAVNQQLAPLALKQILDIGCGEGYYTQQLCQQQTQVEHVIGIDISKDGIKMAAKRCQQAQFFVASNHRLPLADHSIDCVVRIFAPSDQQELLRVSRPGAYLLKVVPGARHLWQLRKQLYKELQEHLEQAESMAGWQLLNQQKITQQVKLKQQEMQALAAMTPFAWKKNQQLEQLLASEAVFDMDFEFVLQLYQRA